MGIAKVQWVGLWEWGLQEREGPQERVWLLEDPAPYDGGAVCVCAGGCVSVCVCVHTCGRMCACVCMCARVHVHIPVRMCKRAKCGNMDVLRPT